MKRPTPNELGYHILVAIGGTLVLMVIVVFMLKIFTRHGKEFEMPSFIGKDAEELTQNGKIEGFVFEVTDLLYDEKVEPGKVLKQDPAPGEKVKKGRKVYLVVSTAEPPVVKMPELHDISLRQAQLILESQGLILDNVIEKPSPYENAVLEVLYRGHIIATGTEIKMGEKISLVVGKNLNDLPDSAEVVTSEL